jgi:hypothetical protein
MSTSSVEPNLPELNNIAVASNSGTHNMSKYVGIDSDASSKNATGGSYCLE